MWPNYATKRHVWINNSKRWSTAVKRRRPGKRANRFRSDRTIDNEWLIDGFSGQRILEEAQEKLEENDKRRDENFGKMEKTMKKMIEVKSGIEHLADKLHHLKSVGSKGWVQRGANSGLSLTSRRRVKWPRPLFRHNRMITFLIYSAQRKRNSLNFSKNWRRKIWTAPWKRCDNWM